MDYKVMKKVLEANEFLAGDIRRLLAEKKTVMFNLISSPGSGKTTILEKTIPLLSSKYKIGIIEGDVETERDAQRLQRFDLPMVLINTHGACHLDSETVLSALQEMPLDDLDIIFVENVGNLVCPAEFDIGENGKIAVLSTPEGDDKPQKYPLLFRECKLVLLNKIDLLSVVNFSLSDFCEDLSTLNGSIPILEMAATSGMGVDEWLQWIEQAVQEEREAWLQETNC